MRVEPERGRPTMKIGAVWIAAAGAGAKKAASKKVAMRAVRRSKLSMSKGASRRRSALPRA